MKTKIIILLCISLTLSACSAPKTTVATAHRANTELLQLTGGNDYIVSVSGDGVDIGTATTNAVKQALSDLLFKGISSNAEGRQQTQKPLVNESVQSSNQDYFNQFFSSEVYRDYAEEVKGVVPKIARIRGGGFNVTIVIKLKAELLRQKLERDGIIKSLSNIL